MDIDIFEYLGILKKHATMLLLLCLSATITTVLFTYVGRARYEAAALVLVRPTEKIHISSTRDEKELLNFPVSGGTGKVEIPSNT